MLSLFHRAFPSPSLCYYTLVDLQLEDGSDVNKFILCFLLIGKQGLELYPSFLVVEGVDGCVCVCVQEGNICGCL